MIKISDLPAEMLLKVHQRLSPSALKMAVLVSHLWKEVGEEPAYWEWCKVTVYSREDITNLAIRRLQRIQEISINPDNWGTGDWEAFFLAAMELSCLKKIDGLGWGGYIAVDPGLFAKSLARLEDVDVKSNSEAFALTRVLVGKMYLDMQQKQKETKAIIDEVEELLNNVDGVSPVHSHYYLLASDLYKIQGRHAEFYRSSLRYLGCTDISTLSTEEKQKNAFFLSLAALLGEGVYNFGELLAHPVLQTLKGTENEWLIDLLFAFNSGDVQKFRSVRNKWTTQADLAANENLLFEKVCLLCLMEMTFRREATQRQITFKEISEATTLPVNQVELLVMKALSQGLVKGKIDQVGEVVHLTWVQARVLNTDQLKVMMTKINSWCTAVADMERLIENKAGDILTF